MSIYLHWLLPNSPWVLAAIGRDKVVRTFLATEEGHQSAEEFIVRHSGNEIRVLAGRARTILSSVPTKQHVADVCAVGVRTSLSQMAAIRGLQNAPAILFEYRGELIAAWRFAKPVNPDDAEKAESFLAERFKGKRLNFFIPVPVGVPVINFDRRYIDTKNMEAQLKGVAMPEEDAFMSATSEPEQRSWVIEPIVQRKKITLLSGEAGMGKSQIALDFAMRLTRGIGLPGQPAPPVGGVMICENEDDWLEDVIPRLIAVGADRRLIKGIHAEDLHTEAGIARLEKVRKRFEAEVGATVAMTVLSPYMACFGGGSNQEAHMREKLTHISRWAKDTNMAVLGVAHLDRQGGVAGAATHRRLARGSWKVIVNEDDPEPNEKRKQRLMVADKANNAPDDFALAYRIKGVTLQGSRISTSKIVWEEPIVPVDVAVAANKEPEPLPVYKYPERVHRYASALMDIFKPGGSSILGSEVTREIGKRHLTWGRSVFDAADALGIVRGDRNGIKSKPWTPPSEWPKEFREPIERSFNGSDRRPS